METDVRKIDIAKEPPRIADFIREYLREAGFSKLVLGLSGGLDSSVCAALAVQAIGSENVQALMLPYRSSSPQSLDDARLLAEKLELEYRIIPITPLVDAYFTAEEPDAGKLRKGNLMARIRMCLLFDQAAARQALVLGTSNRTELMVGYSTQYGDSACALEPIGHLYKTEVRALAQLLGIPQQIIAKAPTADLWQGQSDESELGMPYAELDEILWELTERRTDLSSGRKLLYPLEQYRKVEKMIERSAFKRALPALPRWYPHAAW